MAFTKNRYNLRDVGNIRGSRLLMFALSCYGISFSEPPGPKRTGIKLVRIVQGIVMHALYLDYMSMIFIYGLNNRGVLKALCAYGLQASTVLCLWHTLQAGKTRIASVLRVVLGSSKTRCNVDLLTLLTLVFPLLSALLMVRLMTLHDYRYYTFYFYSKRVDTSAFSNLAYLFGKYIAQCILLQVFPGLVTLLYCKVCHRLATRLRRYRRDFRRMTSDVPTLQHHRLLQHYLQLLDTISDVEAAFSKAAFFLTVSSFLSVFTILATSFYYSQRYVTPPTQAESAITFATCGIYLIASVGLAAQVPLEVDRNSRLLRRWMETRRFLDSRFEMLVTAVLERPPVLLSGWEVFYFRRNGILAMFGTLLTYGLLILQLRS